MTGNTSRARRAAAPFNPLLLLIPALPLAGCSGGGGGGNGSVGTPSLFPSLPSSSTSSPPGSPPPIAPPTGGGGGAIQTPPVPTGLAASAGNMKITLTWAPSTGATSYVVSRATSGNAPLKPVATPTGNTFTDKGLANGRKHFYVVAAVNAAGTSANSTVVSATPTGPNAGTGYWHTSAEKIVDANGAAVRIAGITWYGFETTDFIAHGLYAQDYKGVLNTIKGLGYNLVRIPFSNELVERNPVPTNFTRSVNGMAANTALVGQTALTDLDIIITYAGSIGLRVILDNHRSEAGNSNEASGLWYTPEFPQRTWLADWKMLAIRYSDARFTFNGNPTVVGVELRNAPHLIGTTSTSGSCWTGDTAVDGCPVTLTAHNWPVAAQGAGNAILAVNPNLLVFVDGVDCYTGVCGWQGGNLLGVANNPVVLNVPNQLAYAAHDWGPALKPKSWFNAGTTAASLTLIWNRFWGYLSMAGTAPVWLCEFGTDNAPADVQSVSPGSQGQWFASLIAYLQANPGIHWTYWALNGEDRYALLDANYDATPVSALKQSLLQGIQFPLP